MKDKNKSEPGGDIGSKSHKRQSLSQYEGKPKAENRSESIDGFVDRSTKKPYGKKSKSWAANSGKLGDLDPRETDMPSWVNTWSPHNTGPGGAGVTIDENYGALRPRTQTRQEERFKAFNPEFQDVADVGDWTSYEFTEKV